MVVPNISPEPFVPFATATAIIIEVLVRTFTPMIGIQLVLDARRDL